ncbi:MAG: hypothetical protein Fur006_52680 [Coleofasciculaceae cyanobacterium]
METLEDKGDKGSSTEKEKYICSHWDAPLIESLANSAFPSFEWVAFNFSTPNSLE